MIKHYLFVIDTNSYAGNFEREMCAYLTGQVGDCEVGHERAKVAKREMPREIEQFEDIINQVPDEHGCCRPVSIFPNPNHRNNYNSVAIYFCSIPNSKLMKLLKERAQKFPKLSSDMRRIKVEGFRLFAHHEDYIEIPPKAEEEK